MTQARDPVTPQKPVIILDRNSRGEIQGWACRGEGKGCKRNTNRAVQKPCVDCYGPLDPRMTMGEVLHRLRQGDA